MEPVDLILIEQDKITTEFAELLQNALHPPNPMAIRDASWGRCSLNLEINLDEFDPNMLSRLLPRLREIHGRFMNARKKELDAIRAVQDALPDPSLNLENRPLA